MSAPSTTASASASASSAASAIKSSESKDVKEPAVAADDMRVVVLSWPSMNALANSICAAHPKVFRKGGVNFGYFPDGWMNVSFEALKSLENRHVVFLGSLYARANVLEQISLMMVLPRQHIKSLSIVLPYFAPATMERVDEEGMLASAETTAKIISSCIPLTRSGPAVLRVFDIHALPVRFYFNDNVMMRMMTAVPLLQRECPPGQTTIAFPDEGAMKRFKKFFVGSYSIIVCSKVREGDKRIIHVSEKIDFPKDADAEKKALEHVVIIDDLAQSGGTLHECRVAIQKQLGVPNCSAFVTHPVFPNEGWKKFLPGGVYAGMHRFFVTNTVPEIASIVDGKGPFRVLDISQTLTDDILASLNIKDPAPVGTAAAAPANPTK